MACGGRGSLLLLAATAGFGMCGSLRLGCGVWGQRGYGWRDGGMEGKHGKVKGGNEPWGGRGSTQPGCVGSFMKGVKSECVVRKTRPDQCGDH